MRWLYWRFEDLHEERRFTAACWGAKIKDDRPRRTGGAKGTLRDVMGLVQRAGQGKSKVTVEHVAVSREEMEKRQKEKVKSRDGR